VPYEIAPGTSTMVLTINGADQAPAAVTVADSAPGILLADNGQAQAQNQDGTANTPQNRAAAGTTVKISVTGIGAVSNQPASGDVASWDAISEPMLPVTAWVNGVAAPVISASLVPGSVGVAQISLQVPRQSSGTYPLVIQIGLNTSHVAMLSTK